MRDFADRVGGTLLAAGRRGIRVTAGAGGGDMEVQQLVRSIVEDDHPTGERPRHLETPAGARDPGRPDGSSRLCYFLDGVQTTREVGRIGPVPVVTTSVAAAVVERCERRLSRMTLGGPPNLVRAVILPRGIGDARVEALWDLLREAGLAELGPDEEISAADLLLDSTDTVPVADPADYAGMRDRALSRVRTLRERLEGEMLRRWEGDDRVLDSDGWIAVDGQLGEPSRRAVGLIKSVARPEFVGEDVGMLLDLAPGKRTTSFIPDWQLRRDLREQRTSWYMRTWPPQPGADALGSLMRVEAPNGISPEEVDEITRWVLAEKAPLAKPDARWPAMIYPIHYVEKVLKPLVQSSERAYSKLERQLASNGRN